MSEEMDQMSNDKVYPTDMSDDNPMFSAKYKDSQFKIVEVAMCNKSANITPEKVEEEEPHHILPDMSSDSEGEPKYLQVLETSKGLVQLDLLNFALVKGSDGNTYQMVSTDSTTADNGDTTITCVLSSDDVEDGDNQDSYVMLQTDDDEEQDPYIYLQTAQQHKPTDDTHTEEATTVTPKVSETSEPLTPIQILEKAKALQKAKAQLLSSSAVTKSKRGRKRKSDLPPPMELLSSPNFKLYLYSCKQCTFKCNATKEMTAHKKSSHSSSSKRPPPLQCARCPYKGHTHAQLMKHVRDSHAKAALSSKRKSSLDIQLDSEEVEAADVLVCGACGFESGDRPLFREHIETEHGARSTLI